MYKKLLAGMLISAFATQSYAIDVELDLSHPESTSDNLNSVYAKGYEYSDAASGLSASVSGYSYNRNGYIRQTWVGNWSAGSLDYGLGIERSSSPNHTIDNYNSDYDMLLIEFSQAVELSGVEIGYRTNQFGSIYGGGRSWNSEMTVLAYDGDDFSGFGRRDSWDDLLGDSWSHAGDYRIDRVNTTEEVNTGGLISQYWLVGAYNSNLGGTSNYTDGDDFFKLTSISAQVNPVPLPGSMLMFGLALLGAGAYRRRKAA